MTKGFSSPKNRTDGLPGFTGGSQFLPQEMCSFQRNLSAFQKYQQPLKLIKEQFFDSVSENVMDEPGVGSFQKHTAEKPLPLWLLKIYNEGNLGGQAII